MRSFLSRWPRILTACLAVLFLATGSVCLPAQDTRATLSGTILDTGGKAIPNATVLVRNESAAVVQSLNTDSQGHFSATNLPAGKYTLDISAAGFASTSRKGLQLDASQSLNLSITLKIEGSSEQVVVEAYNSGSIAAQLAPMDGLLEARSARTEINSMFIQNFTSPIADYSELTQMAPGTFSVNSNGVGLGDSKMYFRGFADGLYDITYDGIPFNDTNTPTHHSWAFFPSQWIGGIDFDRSPGSASTIGPTPFGGSINLLSKEMPTEQNIRGGISYGSFNTKLMDFDFDSGAMGGVSNRNNLLVDFHKMTSDGYQTFNYQERNAGSVKYQLKVSDKTTLTGFSGVLMLDSNTPNVKGPTRAQAAQYGDNYLLQNTDPTQGNYYRYNFYHVPTDFEYVGVKSEFGKGWFLDSKPYTYSYNNAQYYANTPPSNKSQKIDASCATPVTSKGITSLPCAVDKVNSYRKYGEVTSINKASRFGVFRTGFWYEWATTNRFQIPSNPLTKQDQVLPNFHERFYTNSYQPFVEYEYHATGKLTITGGLKYAYYNMDLKQYADNGKTVGNLGGKAAVEHSAGYHSYLPSVDANYRLRNNWSVYGQFSTGSVIPPSSVFDVTGANVQALPKPTYARTYQTGSVVKLKRVTLNTDYFYTHFENAYSQSTDQTCGVCWISSGASVTKGFEGEANLYIAHGLSFYANGTVGTAKYVSNGFANKGLWVADAPSNTEALGLTYQQKYLDFGIFNKRVGPMWNDNGNYNQVIPIDPFNITNMFFNYTVRNGSHFDQTKIRLSFNNLFDQHNITNVNMANSKLSTFQPSGTDTLGLLPGRSVTVSVTFGFAPRGR